MKKNGISLIVLVITIIVIIILAGAVILSLINNNPTEEAKEAVFKLDATTYKSEVTLSISNQYLSSTGSFDPKTFNRDETNIKEIITTLKESTIGKLEIFCGKLVYIPDKCTAKEAKWFEEVDIWPKETEDVSLGDITEGDLINSVRVLNHIDAVGPANDDLYPKTGTKVHTINEWMTIFDNAETQGKVEFGEWITFLDRTLLAAAPKKTGWAMVKLVCNNSDQKFPPTSYNYIIGLDFNNSKLYDTPLNNSFPKTGFSGGDYEYVVFRISDDMVKQKLVYAFIFTDKFSDTSLEDLGQIVTADMRIIYDDEVEI